MRSPDESLNCLLLYPVFSQFSFWNTREAVATVGAKAPAPPLGLITIAAILPQIWQFRLLDLNTSAFDNELWNWADIVCVGGMLPQQQGILETIQRAKRTGKFVVVGGPDPSSQPELYKDADALVTGEGEETIPIWLESWRNGTPRGRFDEKTKPDVSKSPVPRYDLLKFEDYFNVGVQYSRGCPFNCEFCDIIELYGRKPRHKTPDQLLIELETIYKLGFRGYIEIVDDNFIGNIRHIKREMLPALIAWNKKHRYPFYFGTEASMNIGDDEALVQAMSDAKFRFVFMGIETPDPDLLMMTQKSQNTIRPIKDRVRKLVEHGILVTGGFILGFDNEKPGTDKAIAACVEETSICVAMLGLLVALPNTQLTRRLLKEKRLLSFDGKVVTKLDQAAVAASMSSASSEVVDQTLAGLNFVTTRDRLEIMAEFGETVREIYSPQSYFRRIDNTIATMRYQLPRLQHRWEFKRSMRGLRRVSWALLKSRDTRWLFIRTTLKALAKGAYRFEIAMTLLGLYLHFQKQSRYLVQAMDNHREGQKNFPRQTFSSSVAEDKESRPA